MVSKYVTLTELAEVEELQSCIVILTAKLFPYLGILGHQYPPYHVVKIKSFKFAHCAICIYRKQEIPVYSFLEEVEYFLNYILHVTKDIVIVLGDFNVHFDTKPKDARDVTDIFACYGLAPMMVGPTHEKGHTLDQIFINSIDIYDTPPLERFRYIFYIL